jgi:hypothetical protein
MGELELVILGSVILGFNKTTSNTPTHETLTSLQALDSLSKCKTCYVESHYIFGICYICSVCSPPI